MKLLYVLDCSLDVIGGSQKSTIATIEYMKKKEAKISLISEKCEKNIDREITNYFFENKKNKYINIFHKMKFFMKVFKDNNFDIVHVQNTRYSVIIGMLLKFNLIRKGTTKFIYTDRDFLSAYTKTYQKLFKFIANLYDYVITTTKANERLWKEICRNVVTIPNALEDEWFEYDENVENDIKNKMNLTKQNFNIGFSGRYVGYKRWDNVFKISEKLKENEDFIFSFSIASTGKNLKEIEIYTEKLKKLLGNRAKIGIDYNKKQMEKFYYSLDAFVLTSNKESFGRTLIEAMTKSNIVVGTNSGGVPEVIGNENFLFEVEDIDRACNILLEYCEDREKLEKVKTEFMLRAKEMFTIKKMGESYYKIYQRKT